MPLHTVYDKQADKFGIKFWLAADVDSRNMEDGFPCLEKDDSSGVNVVLKLVEPFLTTQTGAPTFCAKENRAVQYDGAET